MQQSGYNSTYISTATTTLVFTGAGILHELSLTETSVGTITVYDSLTASGTIKAVLKASIAEGDYLHDIDFTIGCTIVTAGASKLTAAWVTAGRT